VAKRVKKHLQTLENHQFFDEKIDEAEPLFDGS
jgi:hypothetical protein